MLSRSKVRMAKRWLGSMVTSGCRCTVCTWVQVVDGLAAQQPGGVDDAALLAGRQGVEVGYEDLRGGEALDGRQGVARPGVTPPRT